MQRALMLIALILGLLISLEVRDAGADDFRIRIERKHHGDDCTSGYLAVDGNIIAYTLELPWRGNAPEISSIPPGSYPATLRYDKSDRWRLQLTNVPGRDGVQIHIGNYTSEVRGCVLVGAGISGDLCTLRESRVAYDRLKQAFYGTPTPVSTPNKSITVDIVR